MPLLDSLGNVPNEFDRDFSVGDAICQYVYRKGVRFPYPLEDLLKQPYITNFLIEGFVADVLNAMYLFVWTLRGRVEAILNVPQNPRSIGEVISYITKSIRDMAGLIDEIRDYRRRLQSPNHLVIIYVELGLFPLGFYIAYAPPILDSQHDVALNAILLHKALYNKEFPSQSRIYKRQNIQDERIDEQKRQERIAFGKKVMDYIIKRTGLEEVANLIKESKAHVQEVIDIETLSKLSGLSFYDSVVFYWLNYEGPDSAQFVELKDLERSDNATGLVLYSYYENYIKNANSDYYIRSVSSELRSPSGTLSNVEDHQYNKKNKILGVSKTIDNITAKQFVKSIIQSVLSKQKVSLFDSFNIYQTYGLSQVFILPFSHKKSYESTSVSSYSNADWIINYANFREMIDAKINMLYKNVTAQAIGKKVKEIYAKYSGIAKGKVPKKPDTNTEEQPQPISDEDLQSLFPTVYQQDKIEDEGAYSQLYMSTFQTPEAIEFDAKYSDYVTVDREIEKSVKFVPGSVLLWKHKIDEEFHQDVGALHALSRIKRFGDESAEHQINMDEYAEFIRKIFLPSSDNSFEMATFIKSFYDDEYAASIAAAHQGSIGRIYGLTEERKDKSVDESVVKIIENKMSIVRNIIDESVFKLMKYYEILQGLSGVDLSAPCHYMVGLEPFSNRLPDLPIFASINARELDKVMARVLGSEAAAINLGLQLSSGNNTNASQAEENVRWSIYRDFLPIKSISIAYDDIESTSIEFFGYTFNLPSNWNSLKPNIKVSVYDFFGQPFTRYWQAYRKLVFRNNGAWPILHMAFILDVIGMDKTLNVTDLASFLVVPKSITLREIDFNTDSESALTDVGAVDIEFEVIGFIDYVDLIARDGALIGAPDSIETVNMNRIADDLNAMSQWYHMGNINPLPGKYMRYTNMTNKEIAIRNKVAENIDRTTRYRSAHLVSDSYLGEKDTPVRVYQPSIFGRTVSTRAVVSQK